MSALTGSGYDAPSPLQRTLGRLSFRLSIAARQVAARSQALRTLPTPRFAHVAILVIGATGLYGMTVGGHTVAVVDGLFQPLGFSMNDIDVSGNRETTEIDVLQALWSTGAQSLPALDPDKAREALETMPWIETASVAKIYPDRVAIKLTERTPYALWQNGQELFIVDKQGRDIVPFPANRSSTLPLVVGAGAATHAAEFLDDMKALPALASRVRAYLRVGDRRWDLRLDNGVTIRLPEDKPIEAAAAVMKLDEKEKLLDRDILAVDMRLDDRMVIKLTPAALERRNAALKQRQKIIAKAGKDKPV